MRSRSSPSDIPPCASVDELLELGIVDEPARRQLELIRLERVIGPPLASSQRLRVAMRIAEIMTAVYGLGAEPGEGCAQVHLSPQHQCLIDALLHWLAKFGRCPTRAQLAGAAGMGKSAANRAIEELIRKGVLHARHRRIGMAAMEIADELRELIETFAHLRSRSTGAGGMNGKRPEGAPRPDAKDVRGTDAAAPREGRSRLFDEAHRKQRRAA